PAALAPRHAIGNFGFTGLASVFRPVLPWVSGERILAVRVKKYRKFPALLDAKARTNPDVLQSTGVVKQAEEQRTEQVAIPFLVPATSCHDTIAVALVFYLEHHAFVWLVGS